MDTVVNANAFTPQQLERLRKVFTDGSLAAGNSLSMLTGRNVTITIVKIAESGIEEVSGFFQTDETPVVMIPLRISSEKGAHLGCMVFVMLEESAKRLNQLLWENINDGVTVLNISDVSAIKEMGNIVGSCYISSLADACRLEMRPSDPIFVYDMIAALMDALLVEHSMLSDRVLLVETHLETTAQEIALEFIFLPSPELAEIFVEKLT